MTYSYGTWSCSGRPIEAWYMWQDAKRVNVAGFEYVWLQQMHPELTAHCRAPDLPSPLMSVLGWCIAFATVLIPAGLIVGWGIYGIASFFGAMWSPWIIGIFVGLSVEVALAVVEVSEQMRKMRYFREEMSSVSN